MKKQYTAAIGTAIILFLLIAGTQVHRFMDAPDRVEQALGVQTPGKVDGMTLLRDVEIFPGYARVEVGGVVGNPETWTRMWFRLSDVTFVESHRSRVQWESGKVFVEHQQPLSRHKSLAAEVIAANVWNLVIWPAVSAFLIGYFTLLGLSSAEADRLRRLRRCRKSYSA